MTTEVEQSEVLTFCFTDIVDSTRLWEEAEEMAPALRLHDDILKATIAENGGRIFSITGDGFGASFERPDDAVRASVLMQQRLRAAPWPTGAEITVRIGIHLGRAEPRDGNFFGPAVNQSARLMSAASGRQVLISDHVRAALRDWPTDEEGLASIGSLKLKGVAGPMVAHSIRAPGVEVASPAPTRVPRQRIPQRLSSIIGRDEAVRSIREMLAARRLVTIVGVGGVGKTTMASEIARLEAMAGGDTATVSLGRVDRPGEVDGALSEALGLAAAQPIDAIVETALADREILLVVDNCEHLVDEVASLIRTVLERTTCVRVLATSREPLRVPGEHVAALDPLPITVESGESPAVALFRRRAEELGVVYETNADLTAIEELCVRLDGLPLAIELCAAKARALDPSTLLDLLEERFDLLTNHRVGVDERHHTLEATFAWSYELLDDVGASTFDQLSVFVGPFDLEDAVALCVAEGRSRGEVISAVTSLVERSLIQRAQDGPAFRLLESLREFARAHLSGSEDEERVRRRHAELFAAKAREIDGMIVGPTARAAADLAFAHTSNFEAAVKWATSRGDHDLAIGIVCDLVPFGQQFGWRHGPSWLSGLLDDPPDPLPERWPQFLGVAALRTMYELGAARRSRELAARALELDSMNPAALLVQMHVARSIEEAHHYAERLAEAVDPASTWAGDRQWLMASYVYGGFDAMLHGDWATVVQMGRDLQVKGSAWDDAITTGWGKFLVAAGTIRDDPARSLAILDEALDIAAQQRNTVLEFSVRRHIATALIATGQVEAAEEVVRPALARALDQAELDQAARFASLVGVTRALLGDDEVAAQLIGRLGVARASPIEHGSYDGVVNELRQRLGERASELAEVGRALSIEGANRLALQTLEDAR